MKDGVEKNEDGLWEVFTDGRIVARTFSNEMAWREYDRHKYEYRSKIEETTDWVWRKSINR